MSLAPITSHETTFNVKSNAEISFSKQKNLKTLASEMEEPAVDAERNDSVRQAKFKVIYSVYDSSKQP